MSGLPGSGKDTWVKNHRPDLPVVSLDSIRRELNIEPTENQGAVAQLAKQRCRELLRSGTSFAFNATNLIRQTRSGWIDLFHDYKAKIEIVYLEPSLEAILRQNKNRNATVPQRVIEFVPIGFSVTDQIHPVPRPLFTQLRRLQQLVHNSLMCSIAIIF